MSYGKLISPHYAHSKVIRWSVQYMLRVNAWLVHQASCISALSPPPEGKSPIRLPSCFASLFESLASPITLIELICRDSLFCMQPAASGCEPARRPLNKRGRSCYPCPVVTASLSADLEQRIARPRRASFLLPGTWQTDEAAVGVRMIKPCDCG